MCGKKHKWGVWCPECVRKSLFSKKKITFPYATVVSRKEVVTLT